MQFARFYPKQNQIILFLCQIIPVCAQINQIIITVLNGPPEDKIIETYRTEPQAKKALKNYLIFHHATEARNEYKVEKIA